MVLIGIAKVEVGYKKEVIETNPKDLREGDCKRINRKEWVCRKDNKLMICNKKEKKCKRFKGFAN